MGNEEGSLDVATVGILSLLVKNLLVVLVVVEVHGSIEG